MVWEEGITLGPSVGNLSLPTKDRKTPFLHKMDRNHPIDRILDHYTKQNKVATPPAASSRTFARRTYLDLIGILPTPEQLNAFIKDESPDKKNNTDRSTTCTRMSPMPIIG